jgi:lysine 2,3-aminomutase
MDQDLRPDSNRSSGLASQFGYPSEQEAASSDAPPSTRSQSRRPKAHSGTKSSGAPGSPEPQVLPKSGAQPGRADKAGTSATKRRSGNQNGSAAAAVATGSMGAGSKGAGTSARPSGRTGRRRASGNFGPVPAGLPFDGPELAFDGPELALPTLDQPAPLAPQYEAPLAPRFEAFDTTVGFPSVVSVPNSEAGVRIAIGDAPRPALDGGIDAPPAAPAAPRVESDSVREYRRRFHPEVSDAEWDDWKWQLRNRVRDAGGLETVFRLSDDERATVEQLGDRLPVGITPYYAALMDRQDASSPLRRTMVPLSGEFREGPGEADDPLGEDHDMPVPGLVHRYPDRVLFLVSTFCATYCRYCTRARMVGKTGEYHFNRAQYERAVAYIAATPTIRDVLISGGDPLTMADDRIDWLLGQLRAIPHVEFVRIGSKVPAVLPQRITPELCAMLKKHHPFWLSVHFMHPDELTPEVSQALGRLADAGIPMGSQTVLLKDVNDNVPTMKKLVQGLLKNRVRPYYLYQCDPISGSSHLRTSVQKGVELIEGLRGHTTGYAIPTFVVDAPGGGGKIPVSPDYVVGRDGDDLVLRNYSGKQFRYHDPLGPGETGPGAGRAVQGPAKPAAPKAEPAAPKAERAGSDSHAGGHGCGA